MNAKSKLDRLMFAVEAAREASRTALRTALADTPIGQAFESVTAPLAPGVPFRTVEEELLAEGYVFAFKDGILDVYMKRQVCQNTLAVRVKP